MKILVTGISGRIGANLASALVKEGHEVRGLVWQQDKRPEKLEALDVELVEGSLVNPDDVNGVVEGAEVICHLGAAFQGGGPFTHEDYFDINVRGTFNMLEAAKRQGERLQHFFFASTDAIYQKYLPGGIEKPIREDEMPVQPVGWYSLSKQLGENLCLGYFRSHGVPITIFRFAFVVAADSILNFDGFKLSHWLKVYEGAKGEPASKTRDELNRLWNGEEQLVIARDENGRTHKKHILDVRDIVAGFISATGKEQAAGETFQLAAPTAFTWEKAVPYLSNKLGLEYADVQMAGQIPTFYEFDLSKTRSLIGFEPQFDIFRMIDTAIDYRNGIDTGVIPANG